MRLANKRGFYISNSRKNALLWNTIPDIRDAFWFENPKEITENRLKEYIEQIEFYERNTV